jgi:hypothetical protein
MSSATVGHAFKMSVLTPEEEQERQVQIFKVGPCQLGSMLQQLKSKPSMTQSYFRLLSLGMNR